MSRLKSSGVLNYGFREEIAETMVASCRAVACPCNMDVDGCGWMWMKDSAAAEVMCEFGGVVGYTHIRLPCIQLGHEALEGRGIQIGPTSKVVRLGICFIFFSYLSNILFVCLFFFVVFFVVVVVSHCHLRGDEMTILVPPGPRLFDGRLSSWISLAASRLATEVG